MIKVIFVSSSLQMLLFGENLVERIHGEEGHPLNVQAVVNFTNVLWAAFTRENPESAKRH